MNANTELLKYVSENSNMGIESTTKLIKLITKKDNKIKSTLEDTLKGYEKINKESNKLLKHFKVKPCSKILATLTGNIAMTNEVDSDNSDSKIADIMIRGLNMGITDIEKRIKSLEKDKEKTIINLANELLSFSEKQLKIYKDYL